MDYLFLIIILAIFAANIIFYLIFSYKRRGRDAKQERLLREEMKQNREEMTNTLVRLMGETRKDQNERQEIIGKRIGELTDSNEKALGSMRDKVEERLKAIQDSNEKKLEKMRETVDEKLQSTLEKRIGESFKRVSEHLEAVHKGLGEMKNLANGVGDLKKVLTNVKTRGTWGEVQLGNILEQIMTHDQYGTNMKTLIR